MAQINTQKTSGFEIVTWDVPGDAVGALAVPVQEIRFELNGAGSGIPAVGAGDTALTILTFNMPRNFVWMIKEFRIMVSASASASIDDYSKSMRIACADGSGDQVSNFELEGGDVFQSNVYTPGTEDNWRLFIPRPAYTAPLDCASGAGTIVAYYYDEDSAGTTGVVTMYWTLRCLGFSQEQFRQFAMHTPSPTIGPM